MHDGKGSISGLQFLNFEPFSEKEVTQMNTLQIAYIGDSVWQLIVKNHLIRKGLNVHHMHTECIRMVNAHAQASFLQALTHMLSPEENELIKRGRNAHARHPVPKNQHPEDYSLATAFEVLIGFLYMTGSEKRLNLISETILGGEESWLKEKT